MLSLFTLPILDTIFSDSSNQVGSVMTAVYPLLMFLAIPIGLTLLGLAIWAAMKTTKEASVPIYGLGLNKGLRKIKKNQDRFKRTHPGMF